MIVDIILNEIMHVCVGNDWSYWERRVLNGIQTLVNDKCKKDVLEKLLKRPLEHH
jgi:hypothetical protein